MPRSWLVLPLVALLAYQVAPPATARADCSDASCQASPAENARLRSTPAAERIRRFVCGNNLPCVTRGGRPVFATHASPSLASGYLAQLSPGLVEFFLPRGGHHLFTRIGDSTYSRLGGLSEEPWRPGSGCSSPRTATACVRW